MRASGVMLARDNLYRALHMSIRAATLRSSEQRCIMTRITRSGFLLAILQCTLREGHDEDGAEVVSREG